MTFAINLKGGLSCLKRSGILATVMTANRFERFPRYYVYLLLSEVDGTVYLGVTSNIRRRFREHNSPDNRGWTRRRRPWHILAVRCFLDSDTAVLYERQLKRSRFDKQNWIRRERKRLSTLCHRYGIDHPLV